MRGLIETFGYGAIIIVVLLAMQGGGQAVGQFIVSMGCLFLFGAVARFAVELGKDIYKFFREDHSLRG